MATHYKNASVPDVEAFLAKFDFDDEKKGRAVRMNIIKRLIERDELERANSHLLKDKEIREIYEKNEQKKREQRKRKIEEKEG